MNKTPNGMAEQIAQAVAVHEQNVRGHQPQSVTVVFGEDTLVVTLRGALTLAELSMAQSPDGAARMQEFHRRLFDTSSGALRQEIERITGMAVNAAGEEIEPKAGGVVKSLATGAIVQVFHLDGNLTPAAFKTKAPEAFSGVPE